MRRRAVLLKGVTDPTEAKARADELAAKFAEIEPGPQESTTVRTLFTRYRKEVTPSKSKGKQDHDRRASRYWLSFFDAQSEPERRADRHPNTLDRIDWDRFISWRRDGKIPACRGAVGDRTVQYDLKFMVAVLNWASGTPLLDANPWSTETRKAQRWEMPREKSPRRPAMTPELRHALIEKAPGWQFGLALVLGRETRRRNNAIRQLRWSDIDQDTWVVTWRGEADKAGRTNRTPLTPAAVEALKAAPSRGIGDLPVFPAPANPSEPTSRHTFQRWLRRAKAALVAEAPEEHRESLRRALKGVGFHSEKRAGVQDPEFRSLPPKVQEAFSGTSWEMLSSTYDHVTVADIREAMGLSDGQNDRKSGGSYEHQLRAEG